MATSRILPKFIFIITFASITTVHSSRDYDSYYYNLCVPFTCGGIEFSYPFSMLSQTTSPLTCGIPGYEITCDSSDTPFLLLGFSLYQVKRLSLEQRLIFLVNTELLNDLNFTSCNYFQKSIVFPPLSRASSGGYNFSRPGSTLDLSFYICNPTRVGDLPGGFLDLQVINYTCSLDCCGRRTVYLDRNKTQTSSLGELMGDGMSTANPWVYCKQVTVPGSNNAQLTDSLYHINGNDERRLSLLSELSNDGFSLTWPSIPQCDTCLQMNGRCGFNKTVKCFLQGDLPNGNLTKTQATDRRRIIIIVGAASGSSLLPLAAALLVLAKRQFLVQKGKTRYDGPDAEELIRTCQSTLLMDYSFEDIKKMTINFKYKVGEGGYGRVYRGRLLDGRVIAVKMLDKLNNDSKDFANEVGTIGRIHHMNIIKLIGFCYEGMKRALVYEYMPNGCLDDYLHEGGCVSLRMDRLQEIAIGIARGIEYLHTGCESRILHLDIKPQNILLDDDFNPKISDFGLAKMHSRQKSAISMSGARGTVGFIAPEVFLRNFGNPSHKSDVYSFGMLLIEMVGMRTHKVKTSIPSSEGYFPSWIYNKLAEGRNHKEVGDSLEERSRKLSMIALWCIQMNPRDRPSMTRVLEMLSSNGDEIPMPPLPVLCSPTRHQSISEAEYDSTEEEAFTALWRIRSFACLE